MIEIEILEPNAIYKIDNIVNGEKEEVTLHIRYLNVAQMWIFDFASPTNSEFCVRLVCNTKILYDRYNFELIVTDNNNTGLDTFLEDDFTTGRYTLYFLAHDFTEDIKNVAL